MLLGKTLGLLLVLALPFLFWGCRSASSPPPGVPQEVKPLMVSNEKYQAAVYIKAPPLTIGEEPMVVALEDLQKHAPVTDLPKFKAVMETVGDTTEAPLEVTQLAIPGEYEIRPVFTMHGNWVLSIAPGDREESLPLTLYVEDTMEEKGSE